MLLNFNDFKNKTLLESIRKLKLINKVLKLSKIKSNLVLKGEDSYIQVRSNNKESDIQGIMIYPIGNKIAFRVKNSENDLPQGRPKLLDFEKIYNDIYNDHERKKERKDSDIKSAGKVVDDFIQTIKKFFNNESFEKNRNEKVLNYQAGTDYSAMVYSKY